MRIRRAQESDLGLLIALSSAAGTAAHWTPRQWLDIFSRESPVRLAWIADEETGASDVRGIGFLVALNGGLEWELENIAVLPESRRQGVGQKLLSALLDEARSQGAVRIFLEVRDSNRAAICLYSANGFQEQGRRRDYYRSPMEDALIMVHRVQN